MIDSSTTGVLAVWGAIVSTVTFGWNLYRSIKQRGCLRVSCYIGKIAAGEEGLIWNIINVGKEPGFLTHIGGSTKKYKFIMNTDRTLPLPKMLQPGQYVTALFDAHDDLSMLEPLPDLKHLWAITSLGKKFKAPRKQVKKLKRDLTPQRNN
jgi:hypothetical protein